jgi:hypothetical protein
MASKKSSSKGVSLKGKDNKPRLDSSFLLREDSLSPEKFDEVLAGVFSSKRHTGQFDDRLKTAELELLQVQKSATESDKSVDENKWEDCLVHDLDADFSTEDDILQWPEDYNEKNEEF